MSEWIDDRDDMSGEFEQRMQQLDDFEVVLGMYCVAGERYKAGDEDSVQFFSNELNTLGGAREWSPAYTSRVALRVAISHRNVRRQVDALGMDLQDELGRLGDQE